MFNAALLVTTWAIFYVSIIFWSGVKPYCLTFATKMQKKTYAYFLIMDAFCQLTAGVLHVSSIFATHSEKNST